MRDERVMETDLQEPYLCVVCQRPIHPSEGALCVVCREQRRAAILSEYPMLTTIRILAACGVPRYSDWPEDTHHDHVTLQTRRRVGRAAGWTAELIALLSRLDVWLDDEGRESLGDQY